MLTSQVASQILANAEAMQQTQRQLTSGKRITRPGDDPAAAAAGVRMRAQQSRDAQYLRNIEHARTWLDTTDRVLSDTGDLLGRARELAVQASTGTFTKGDTAQLAEEINAIRNQIIAALNGTVDVDQYVFSGQKSDLAPIAVDAKGNATYQGDTGVTVLSGENLSAANGIKNIKALDTTTVNGDYDLAVSAAAPGKVTIIVTRRSDGKAESQTVSIPASGATAALTFTSVGVGLDVNDQIGQNAIRSANTFTIDSSIVTIPSGGDLTKANGIDQIAAQSPVTSKGSYDLDVSAPASGAVTITVTRRSDDKAESQTVSYPPDQGFTAALEFTTVGVNVVVNDQIGKNSGAPVGISSANTFTVDGLGLGHEVAQGAMLETNITASAMLPMLAQLKTFYDALLSGTNVNTASNTAIGVIDTAVDRVLSLRAQVGAKTNHLDFAQARGEARDVENGRLISVNEDIDLTEALSRLTTQQTVYKASLEIGSRVMQNSLMDYLR